MNRRNFVRGLLGAGTAMVTAPVLKLLSPALHFPKEKVLVDLLEKPIMEVKSITVTNQGTGFAVGRDYYCIEWPVVSREWQFGTYAHEALLEYDKRKG
jgi:hypothetical protein